MVINISIAFIVGFLILALIIASVVVAVIFTVINIKKGKCGGGCVGCDMYDQCNKKEKK